jgi:hypothetical protein
MYGRRLRGGLCEGVGRRLEVDGVGQMCSSEVRIREVFVLHTWRLDKMEEGERKK